MAYLSLSAVSDDELLSEDVASQLGVHTPHDSTVGTLRGAQSGVSSQLVVRCVTFAAMGALVVTAAILYVAGAHRNSQIEMLKQHGVPVTVTVSSCLGQLGGSGSNDAGYTCDGTFVVNGRSFTDVLPGNNLLPLGDHLSYISVPSDPSLIASSDQLSSEHASLNVFILPSILLGLFFCMGATILLRRDRQDVQH